MAHHWTYYVRDSIRTSEVHAIYRLSDAWVLEAWTGAGWAPTSRSTFDMIHRYIRNGEVDLTRVDEATATDLAGRFLPGTRGVVAPWGAGGEYGKGHFNRRSPLLKDD